MIRAFPYLPAALAFVLAALGIGLLRRASSALPHAAPNARSLHTTPVPRAGGYAIWLGFLPVALLAPPAFPGGLIGWVPPWLALAVISGRDDVREVGIRPRLSVHALAALWAAVALVCIEAPPGGNDWPRLVLTTACVAFLIAWSANLFNFMDGTDGLAGTMGAVGFAGYGIAAVTGDHASPASAPGFFSLAAAILPFLAVNRPRATMFLGDVGAVPLGFLAAAFGVAGAFADLWQPWFPVLVFLPFLADATVTLLRRMRRGEQWWQGHRAHYYQRLAQLGAGHEGTLFAYALLMIGTTLTALWCRAFAPAAAGWPALGAWCAVVIMLFAAIDYHWRKKTNIPPSS